MQSVGIGDIISVRYYRDRQYTDVAGAVVKIDLHGRYILVGDAKIPLEDILTVEREADK